MVSYAETPEPESNADRFNSASGKLIERNYIKIASLKGIEIEVVHYFDLMSEDSLSAVIFQYQFSTDYVTQTKSAVLDADEIDALMKSLRIIIDDVFTTRASVYTEVSYRSRSGFEAGCYWDNDWKTYIQLKKYDNKSSIFLKKDDFTTLLDYLNLAKARLF
jgi:hypothetical protein